MADRDDPDYSGKYDDVTRRLEHTAEIKEYTDGIFVLDKNGTIIASSDESDIGKDKSNNPFFLGGKHGVFVKDAYFSHDRQIDSLAFSAPVFNEESAVFLGVVVMRVSIEELNKITTCGTGLGETGEIFLVNNVGYMITPSRFLSDTFLKQKVDTFHSEVHLKNIWLGTDTMSSYARVIYVRRFSRFIRRYLRWAGHWWRR